MNSPARVRREEVAGRHTATSAQPPHATSLFPLWSSSRRAPHPFPSAAIPDTAGVLLEGLRCFPAAYPLPVRVERPGKNTARSFGEFQ
jgi:hypothetical protein